MKRGLLRCVAFVVFASSIAAAGTQSPVERARDAFKVGAAAYATGDYLAAIQALETAYELTPLPAIAFSLAQAHRKQYFVTRDAINLERSIELFRLYLRQSPSGGRRADALDALAQLEPQSTRGPSQTDIAADAPAAPQVATRLMITSEAEGATVVLDDSEPAAAPLIRQVEPGAHRAVVSAPGYYPETRVVIALKGELILKEVALRERPSILLLSTPSESDVYIDGNYVSPGGPDLRVELAGGKHTIAVAKNGYHLRQTEVETHRGMTKRVKVTLEPTVQRTTALGLFMGGGALLGGSVVLNALRIRAENRAEDFLLQQSRRNVTSDELLRYKATVAERDRIGLATGIALAGAAGLFVSGLFLHELDQPNLERLPGADARRTEPRTQRTPVQVAVSAWTSPEVLGGVLHGEF